MKGWVYILKDQGGRFYVGSTNDLERRLSQHQSGHTQTTRNMDKPELVLAQEFVSIDAARKIEMKLKKLKRKDYIEKMIQDGCIKMSI